ncbi:MAG: PP2C family protein-serine/threonine phosphatase [Rhodothermales bacterium]
MIDPKQFYRKMDRVLGQIAETGSGSAFVGHILVELENAFGAELHFASGHLYQESTEGYRLVEATHPPAIFPDVLPFEDKVVLMIEAEGGVIFDDRDVAPAWFYRLGAFNAFVGFQIQGPPGMSAIILYGLQPGWEREEIAFCLNGARFAMNYRLKAEAAQSDMDKAAAIQRSLLPTKPPVFKGYEIAVRTQPAEAVGGDMYDFLDLGDDILGIAMGDASGHGLPAALLVRDVIMGIRMGIGTNLKMLYTMKKLNRVIHESTYSTRFISVFFAELEAHGGILYTNAGHTSGIILSGDDVQIMEPTGTIMGPLPDIPLERAYAMLPPGGLFILYTDGITERLLEDGSEFGEAGLIDLIQSVRDLPVPEIVDAVFERALSLDHESDLLEDDATLMIIRRDP